MMTKYSFQVNYLFKANYIFKAYFLKIFVRPTKVENEHKYNATKKSKLEKKNRQRQAI